MMGGFCSRLQSPIMFSSLFRNCMPIPGMKHICDNLVHDMTRSLTHYEAFFNQCSHWDALLGKPFYRDRLADRCLKGTGYDNALAGWDIRLNMGRWSALLMFLTCLPRHRRCKCTLPPANLTTVQVWNGWCILFDLRVHLHTRKQSI